MSFLFYEMASEKKLMKSFLLIDSCNIKETIY